LNETFVGIYRVSSSDRTPKGHRSQTDHRSIHQYFDVVKTLREGNSPRLHQRGYYRQFINKRMKIYISFSHERLPYK